MLRDHTTMKATKHREKWLKKLAQIHEEILMAKLRLGRLMKKLTIIRSGEKNVAKTHQSEDDTLGLDLNGLVTW